MPISPPITMVISNPAHALWVMEENMTPNNAENSIIPSSAMLVIPAFAAMEAPNVANRIGVAARRMVLKKSGDVIALHILCHLPFLQCCFCFFCNHLMFVFTQELLCHNKNYNDSLRDLDNL